MTAADAEVVKSYNVTRQAAHVTINSNGVVLSSVTYGKRERGRTGESFFEALLDS